MVYKGIDQNIIIYSIIILFQFHIKKVEKTWVQFVIEL